MAESAYQSQSGSSGLELASEASIRRWVWKIAIATWILMAIGSATRVMNAGLACPDWPLCYGQLVPRSQMNLQVFLEWFHRLDASLIGISTLALVALSWWNRRALPGWLPRAATVALLLVLFQGALGGLTVTEMLRFDIVTAHLGTALLFFSLLMAIATASMPFRGTGASGKLGVAGLTAALLVYLQSLVGGLVASRWAAHQCLSGSQLCDVMNGHLLGVIPATLATLGVTIWAWRIKGLHPALRYLAQWAGALVALQILLGVGTYKLHLQVETLTVAHQATGAALLGALVALSVLAFRDRATA